MKRRQHLALATAGALLITAATAAGASGTRDTRAAPAPFRLVFDGSHTPTLLHEGTFTTSAAFCPSGSAATE